MGNSTEIRKRQLVTEFRRSEILNAATNIFGSKGFAATRMDDIAKAAGIAKGTLYLYFRSKDSIYQATVEKTVAELSALTEKHVAAVDDFAGKLTAFIAVRMSFWKENQELYQVMLSLNREHHSRRRSLKWQQKAVDYLIGLLTTAIDRKEIPQQDIEAAAWSVMDLIRGVNERRPMRNSHSAEGEAQFLSTFILKALGATQRQAPPASSV
jgi:AcrR family transcriptional regulator